MCVFYVIRKLGVCTFCLPRCFKWVSLLLSSGDSKSRAVCCDDAAVKILEASSDLCHPKKKKIPKEKKIHVLLCSLKSLQSVTLVLFPLNADLYNNEL